MAAHGYAPQPPPAWGPYDPAAPPGPPASKLPLLAVVLAGTALLLALVALVTVLVLTSGGAGGPLTGRVAEARPGSVLAGAALTAEVTRLVEDDGGAVGRITCPDTADTGPGVVTVYHGSISGEEWAVVVFLEDEAGSITLLPV